MISTKISNPDFTWLRKEWKKRIDSGSPIEAFIKHSKESVPFYNKYHIEKICDFPKLHWKNYFTCTEGCYSSKYNGNNSINYVSSGKTGVLMNMRWDSIGAYGCKFEILQEQLNIIGLSLGKGSIGIIAIDDNPMYNESFMRLHFLNDSLYIRKILGKSKKEDFELIKFLRNKSIPLLCAKPRSLKRIMELDMNIPQTNSEKRISPDAIRISGDNLNDMLRDSFENWFKCNVYNFYKSQEGGAIAMDCKHKTGLHLFNKRVYVEVKTNMNEINCIGKGHAVITNFENWAMPFIRYECDDLIQLEWIECPCGYKGYSITEINGSDSPYFNINDSIFNPSIFNTTLEKLPLKQFQVIQLKGKDLLVKWVPFSDNRNENEDTSNLIKHGISKLAKINISLIEVENINEIASINKKGKTLRYMLESNLLT